jgi:hypothetical protein
MAIQTLTGNQFEHGSAIDNTQTDQFVLTGLGNTVQEGKGNIKVTGVDTATFGINTASTVMLDSASGTTDTIKLGGDSNIVMGSTMTSALSGSTVSVSVSGVHSGAGMNAVALVNNGGSTTVALAGPGNVVALNSDATNVVSTGADATGNGNASITIGVPFDDNFGGTAKIETAGSGNTISVGDANATVAGGTSNNTIKLGDGENTVSVTGTGNHISVGGGDNVINAGGSGAVVRILGADGANLTAFASDDLVLHDHPTDVVTVAGAGDLVSATYEDVTVNGAGVTSAANVFLGDGDNSIILGGTGGDTIVVGNGFNDLNVKGDANTIALGDSINQIVLSGNGNTATVKDTKGTGNDSFKLGAGVGDTIAFAMAGGAVSGTATTGVTTITQSAASLNQVVVNLVKGTGAVTLGNGQQDSVTANGDKSVITVGNGKDTITANGNLDVIKFSGNADTVTANGNGDKITGGGGVVTATGLGDTISLGNGANKLTAGSGDTIKVGGGANTITAVANNTITAGDGKNSITVTGDKNSITAGKGDNTVIASGNSETITLGSGNNSVTALGSGDTVTIAANALSHDTVSLGANDSLKISGGTDKISLVGAADTVSANNLIAGSQITAGGNNEMLFLGGNSSTGVHLNPVGTGEQITVQALDATPNFSGKIDVSGFGVGDTMNLNGLGFTSFIQVLQNMDFGPTQDTLKLSGGGTIAFDNPTAFSASEFKFSTTHGLV